MQGSKMNIGKGYIDHYLSTDEIRDITQRALSQLELAGKRVLIIIPDSTRTAPLPLMFRLFNEFLGAQCKNLDFLVALGTHMLMSEDALNKLVGITAEERRTTYAHIGLFNHQWDNPDTFAHIGTIPKAEIEAISNGMLSLDVPVTVNRKVMEYDQVIVCGPVFPHEVMGFSGGTKYFFPGVSGRDVINFTHWLGALITTTVVLGTADTPVRDGIDRAVAMIPTPKLFFNMVVTHHGMAGLFVGDYKASWLDAVQLSMQLHIRYVDKPYQRVLAVMPELYDDLWTAAKGMYKMESVIVDGGEVIIYAPHIDEVSYTHGKLIDRIGYHVRDYFTKQWDTFKHEPWGILAHSTHLRGTGEYDVVTGVERPRIKVTLATGIPRERCERINLGYMDPASINLEDWKNRGGEGILLVPRAGEQLYRLREKANQT
jgi:nickel-dependent lactate racemase